MSQEIEQLRRTGLAIADSDGADRCAAVLVQLEGMKQAIRATEQVIKARLLEWIEANGNCRIDIADGVYYYAGKEKETHCRDVATALEMLLEHNGGDVRGLAEYLSAGAIKYGAARGLLPPEKYAAVFETAEKTKLKEGKAGKVLLRGDERLLVNKGLTPTR